MISVGVYRGPHTNPSDAMTYKSASGAGIDFDFITDPSMTVDAVLARNYNIIDVPDPLYGFTREIVERHPCVVVTVWENLPWNMLPDYWRHCFEKAALVVFRSLMAMQSAIEVAGCDPAKAVVIPAGVDTELFRPAEKVPDTVLYVGRVEWEKGILDLIMAARGQKWQLNIVGDGSLKGYAEAFAGRIGASNVHFLGRLSHEQTGDYYAFSEVFCYPSIPTPGWLEQWGISVTEAASSKCKLVLSDSNAFRYMDELMGYPSRFVTPNDWTDLREKINLALSEWLPLIEIDAVRSETIGKKLREAYAQRALAVGV